MPKNIELGVRLTADGKGFVGAITVSDKAVRKLRGGTDKAAASTRGMAGAMRQAERAAHSAAAGFGAAHGRIASYAAGALGIHQVARALLAVRDNSIRQEQALAQVEARMRSTGGAAGLTTEEVAAMAAALQDATAFGDEAILEAQSVMLTFRRISRETFGDATEAVLDLATAMGQSAQSAAIQLGKALDDPHRGLDALTRSGVVLTDAQKELIRELFAAGRAAEGQKIILKEVAVQMGGAARAARQTLGGALDALGATFGDLLEVQKTSTDGLRQWVEAANSALELDSRQVSELHGDLGRIGEVAIYAAAIYGSRWIPALLKAGATAAWSSLRTKGAALATAEAAAKVDEGRLKALGGANAARRFGGAMRYASHGARLLTRSVSLFFSWPVQLLTLAGYAIYEFTQDTRKAKEAAEDAASATDDWAAALGNLSDQTPAQLDALGLDLLARIREKSKELEAARKQQVDLERGYALEEVAFGRPRQVRREVLANVDGEIKRVVREVTERRTRQEIVPLDVDSKAIVENRARIDTLQQELAELEASVDQVSEARLPPVPESGEAARQYDALGVAKDAADEYLKVAASLRTEREKARDALAEETAAIEANTKAGSEARRIGLERAKAKHRETVEAIDLREAEAALANQRKSGLPALKEAGLRVAELSRARGLDAQALADLIERRRISAEVERSWPEAADGTKLALAELLRLEAELTRQQEIRLSLLERYAPGRAYAEQLRILREMRDMGDLTPQQYAQAAGDVQNQIEQPEREQEILHELGYHTRLEEAQREHSRRMIEIRHGEIEGVMRLLLAAEQAEHDIRNRSLVGNAKAAQSALGVVQTTFGQLGHLSKTAFRISQVAAVGQTLISTFEGAQAAYTWGAKFGGPPLGAVMAAAATAAGLAQVAAIRAQPPPQGFAMGGVVDRPTWFSARGIPSGVAGEAGPEGILPLRRLPSGELGVGSAGGGPPRVVNVAPVISIEMRLAEGGADGAALAGEEAAARAAEAVRSVIADELRPGGLLNRTDVA